MLKIKNSGIISLVHISLAPLSVSLLEKVSKFGKWDPDGGLIADCWQNAFLGESC